ncbi:MAG: CapA family protein [Trueperaceae bacterium]|nr:CapA family protein [Trueperaceae bacterium]
MLHTPAGRLLVFSYGTASAGVPERWRATPERPGVNLLPEPTDAEADRVIAQVDAHRAEGDRVVVSVHWGANWGYDVPEAQRRFAHRLIIAGAADVVHGHSSHHPKGIEVHRGRLVLYGAGDFLNDYEGIGGHEAYRPHLTAAYLPVLGADGALASMELAPMRIRRLRLARASPEDAGWLADRLTREGRPFGTRVLQVDEGRLRLDCD